MDAEIHVTESGELCDKNLDVSAPDGPCGRVLANWFYKTASKFYI